MHPGACRHCQALRSGLRIGVVGTEPLPPGSKMTPPPVTREKGTRTAGGRGTGQPGIQAGWELARPSGGPQHPLAPLPQTRPPAPKELQQGNQVDAFLKESCFTEQVSAAVAGTALLWMEIVV